MATTVIRRERMAKKKKKASKGAASSNAAIVAALEETLGKDNVHRCSDSDQGEPRAFIPSGVPSLDKVLDREGRGWPVGRVVEVFGGEATAKTGFGYSLIAEAQKMGGVGVLYPVEGNYDAWLANQYGVDLDELILGDDETVEGVFGSFNRVLRNVGKDRIVVGVVDSIAGLCTKDEIEAAMAGEPFGRDRSIQVRALLLSQALRRMGALIPRTNGILFCINQVRDNTDAGLFQKRTKPPGGKALKFYASIRLELEVIQRVKRQREGQKFVAGFHIRITSVKNRMARPYQTSTIFLDFENGLQPIVTKKKKKKPREIDDE